MTREQAKSFISEKFGIEEPTKEMIDNFLNTLNGELATERINAKNASASATESANKLAEVQAELEALQNNGNADYTKLTKDFEKLQKQYAELQTANIKSEVKAVLSGAGLSEEDYAGFIDSCIGNDVETSKARANAFITVLNNRVASAEEKVKASFLDNTQGLGNNAGATPPQANMTEAEKLASTLNLGSQGGDMSAFL